MFPKLYHLTMQTAHAVEAPLPAAEAVRALVPFAADLGGDLGGVVPSLAGVRVGFCGRPWGRAVSWDVSVGGAPLALCVLCLSPEESASAWSAVEQTYFRLSDSAPEAYAPGACPSAPAVFPWLATLLLPGAFLHMDVVGWLADFDQCLAHAVGELLDV